MPEIAVVISARNAHATLSACLTALRQSRGVSFELIVVDAASTDETVAIARQYVDTVVCITREVARNKARRIGAEQATAPLVVNIDADVVVRPDTLEIIADYFREHPEIDAVTGMLSIEHTNRNFLSQYKNLYMHCMFLSLPARVGFLYGSLYAFRRELAVFYPHEYALGEDTAFGQRLVHEGKRIAFLKEAEVVHLKKYTPVSFLVNEFLIPLHWTRIYMANKGWTQMVRQGGGFSHASGGQIIGVVLAPCIAITFLAGFIHPLFFTVSLSMFSAWFLTQLGFFIFYMRQRGIFFAVLALVTALCDNMIKAAGILAGLVVACFAKR